MREFIVEYWLEVAFGAVVAGFAWGYRRLAKKLSTQRHREDAVAQGVQALLRNEVIRIYNHSIDRGGICPIYERESVMSMYGAYHALGGNGTITELVDKLQKMPTERN